MLDLRAAATTVVFIPSVNNSNLVLGYILAGSDRCMEACPWRRSLAKALRKVQDFLHKFSSEFRVGNIRHAGVCGVRNAATGRVGGEIRTSAAARPGRGGLGRRRPGRRSAGPGPRLNSRPLKLVRAY